jgi:endogenous inhibitor of DNA gyrase (YacG/DUF329 family)
MSMPSRADSCPLCGKPSEPAHRPFCSQGCKDRDLLNWLDEGYRVPGHPADPDLPGQGQDGLDSDR